MRKLIPIRQHPANCDPRARLVVEDRRAGWAVYSVTGGYVLITEGLAVDGLFPSAQAACSAVIPNANNPG